MSSPTANHLDLVHQHCASNHLGLIILPTEQCNFRCVYCYEDFSIGRMKEPVVAGIEQLITRRIGQLDTLHLSWFGGEPLLAADLIERIGTHALRLGSKVGARVTGSATTNGFLLDTKTARRVVRGGVTHFQITLDGWDGTHDRTRRARNGAATFPRIWENLMALHTSDLPIEVLVRIHLLQDNIDSVRELTDRLRSALGQDPRFSVLFRPVGRWGGPNDHQLAVLEESTASATLAELYERFGQPIASEEEEEVHVCYATRANSLLIRANGTVGKCTVALQDERNTIGQISADGTLRIDSDRLALWTRGLLSGDPDELACPAVGLEGTPKNLAAVGGAGVA